MVPLFVTAGLRENLEYFGKNGGLSINIFIYFIQKSLVKMDLEESNYCLCR